MIEPVQEQVFTDVAVKLIGGGCEIDTQIQVSQPVHVSMTFTQYAPANKPVKQGLEVNTVVAVAWQFVPTNAYFKQGFGVTVVVKQMLPVFPPLQATFVTIGTNPFKVPVAVIHFTIVDVQPLQSVTLIV